MLCYKEHSSSNNPAGLCGSSGGNGLEGLDGKRSRPKVSSDPLGFTDTLTEVFLLISGLAYTGSPSCNISPFSSFRDS